MINGVQERLSKNSGYGTNLEGEWSEVMLAIEACHVRLYFRKERIPTQVIDLLIQKAVHDMGCPRVATDIRKLHPFAGLEMSKLMRETV